MAIRLDDIKDSKLRRRIEDALHNVSVLESEIAQSIPVKPVRKRIRQDPKPLMNKLEQEYYDCCMKAEKNVCIQSVRFNLANGLWYKPDFFYRAYNGILEAVEVKGPHAFRGGFENLKMAAHQYPWIKWVLVWKEDGVWQEQEVLP